jgi:2-oxoglutarate ferredoxin oxidoreductase subunit delta
MCDSSGTAMIDASGAGHDPGQIDGAPSPIAPGVPVSFLSRKTETMSKKEPEPLMPDFACSTEGGQALTEQEMERLKLAHSCTLEQAYVLITEDLKTCMTPVYVFKKWCKGCNICVELCPKETLALGPDFKAYQAKPDDCILCGLCELRCPDFAIFVVQKKDKKKKKEASAAGE